MPAVFPNPYFYATKLHFDFITGLLQAGNRNYSGVKKRFSSSIAWQILPLCLPLGNFISFKIFLPVGTSWLIATIHSPKWIAWGAQKHDCSYFILWVFRRHRRKKQTGSHLRIPSLHVFASGLIVYSSRGWITGVVREHADIRMRWNFITSSHNT